MFLIPFLFFFISYLLGSIPSGLIIGKKFKNIDIREHGSKNIGTTNAFRVLGSKLGILVFIMDLLKGGIPILIGRIFLMNGILEEKFSFFIILYGIAAAIGHMFPIFANFKGGKIVATGFGTLLFYSPLTAIISILIFALTLKITKYVSLGSMFGALSAVITTYIVFFVFSDFRTSPMVWIDIPLIILVTALTVVLIYRHKTNIIRLFNGTENKVKKKN